MSSKADAEEVKRAVSESLTANLQKFGKVIQDSDYLSCGLTTTNLACSGRTDGAFCKGKYFWVIGESSSGKTFLVLQLFAEAAQNKNFDNYDLIFDCPEDGALMDFKKYFGKKMADRVKPPRVDAEGAPVYSTYLEEFFLYLRRKFKAIKAGKAKPFILALDSYDCLTTKYDTDKLESQAEAVDSEKDVAGDFGDGKAKLSSRWTRQIVKGLRDTGSMLVIISQEKDNISASPFESKKSVSGGRSLKYYASWQMWLNVGREITITKNGKEREVGVISKIHVRKNRLTGKSWKTEAPIYWSTGFDDTGAMVDFLVSEKHFAKDKQGMITAKEFDFEGKTEKLIQKIEDEDLIKRLRNIVQLVWEDIEESCHVKRKPRYQ